MVSNASSDRPSAGSDHRPEADFRGPLVDGPARDVDRLLGPARFEAGHAEKSLRSLAEKIEEARERYEAAFEAKSRATQWSELSSRWLGNDLARELSEAGEALSAAHAAFVHEAIIRLGRHSQELAEIFASPGNGVAYGTQPAVATDYLRALALAVSENPHAFVAWGEAELRAILGGARTPAGRLVVTGVPEEALSETFERLSRRGVRFILVMTENGRDGRTTPRHEA